MGTSEGAKLAWQSRNRKIRPDHTKMRGRNLTIAMRKEANDAKDKSNFQKHWEGSASQSVINDYASGNVKTVGAGQSEAKNPQQQTRDRLDDTAGIANAHTAVNPRDGAAAPPTNGWGQTPKVAAEVRRQLRMERKHQNFMKRSRG